MRQFDQQQNQRRVRPKKKIEVPSGLIFDRSLPLSAPHVYAALKYLQIGDRPVRVSHRHLTELTGLSNTTIVKDLRRLKNGGWLKIEFFDGGVNTYHFLNMGR